MATAVLKLFAGQGSGLYAPPFGEHKSGN